MLAHIQAERVRQALLEKKQQEAEEETKKAEAELRRKAGWSFCNSVLTRDWMQGRGRKTKT